jgi:glycosyltransferase involved in cell wall biosynthesis
LASWNAKQGRVNFDKRKVKTALIIPTYNEALNIGKLIRALKLLKTNLKIIVVDDASPDGTGKIVSGIPDVILISRKGKLGLGSAYKAGFKYAFAHGYDVVVTMDADFSHDPKFLPEMIAKIKDCDMVIGSRYIKGGNIIGFNFARKLISGTAQFFSRTVLGLKILDATSGYRVYKKNVLTKIGYASIKSEGYSYLLESLYIARKYGYSVCEVPIVFKNRKLGLSKISSTEIFKALFTVARLKLQASLA